MWVIAQGSETDFGIFGRLWPFFVLIIQSQAFSIGPNPYLERHLCNQLHDLIRQGSGSAWLLPVLDALWPKLLPRQRKKQCVCVVDKHWQTFSTHMYNINSINIHRSSCFYSFRFRPAFSLDRDVAFGALSCRGVRVERFESGGDPSAFRRVDLCPGARATGAAGVVSWWFGASSEATPGRVARRVQVQGQAGDSRQSPSRSGAEVVLRSIQKPKKTSPQINIDPENPKFLVETNLPTPCSASIWQGLCSFGGGYNCRRFIFSPYCLRMFQENEFIRWICAQFTMDIFHHISSHIEQYRKWVRVKLDDSMINTAHFLGSIGALSLVNHACCRKTGLYQAHFIHA